ADVHLDVKSARLVNGHLKSFLEISRESAHLNRHAVRAWQEIGRIKETLRVSGQVNSLVSSHVCNFDAGARNGSTVRVHNSSTDLAAQLLSLHRHGNDKQKTECSKRAARQ